MRLLLPNDYLTGFSRLGTRVAAKGAFEVEGSTPGDHDASRDSRGEDLLGGTWGWRGQLPVQPLARLQIRIDLPQGSSLPAKVFPMPSGRAQP
jgi:hypothetical protein